jgi:dCMP deaminase
MALGKWHLRYLAAACHVSSWSKDPSTKVGAVITDKRGRIIALGFNGFPEKVEDAQHKYADRGIKYEMTVHAEVNALIIAGPSAAGGTIYVYGLPICPRCAGALIQAGIARAVAKAPRCGTGAKWDEDGQIALGMLAEAKIDFDPIGDSDERKLSELFKWLTKAAVDERYASCQLSS